MRPFGSLGRLHCHGITHATLLYVVIITMSPFAVSTAAAFAALPTARTTAMFPRAHKLYGKSRIRRVGPSNDSIPPAPLIDDQIQDEDDAEITVPTMSLEELLLPSPDVDVTQVGSTALAYIGDVVYELMVRARHVWPTRRTSDLQQQVVALVRAEHQAKLLSLLHESPLFELTAKEEQVLLRGRNSASSTRNRKNAAVYQDATALEALIGYLYISDRTRCEALLNWIYAHLDQVDE